jgi:hypothetical protein
MMKKIGLVLGVVLVIIGTSSCHLFYEHNSSFTYKETFESITEARLWVYNNIEYTPDIKDNWQSPEETYKLRQGDCEDMEILFMQFLMDMGIETKLIIARPLINWYYEIDHAFVQINENEWQSATWTASIKNPENMYKVMDEIEYNELMYWIYK